MPSQFVIVGRKGTSFTAPYILTSDDSGLTWAEQASNSLTFDGSGIVYSGAKYVATGFDYTIETSPDGKAWTKITPPSTVVITKELFGVAYNGSNLYVASGIWEPGGPIRTGVLTSPDGVTWTQGSFLSNTGNIGAPAYGNGQWVIPANGNTVIASTDAITWTSHSLSNVRYSTEVIIYAFGLWILSVLDLTGVLTSRLFTSPDLITWTERALPINQYALDQTWYTNINAFALSGNTLYGCTLYKVPGGFNNGGQPLLFQSTDGINWSFGPDVWVPNGADPVALSADLHGNIVMTGNDNVDNNRLYIARSSDSGASWANVYPGYTVTGAELLANPGLSTTFPLGPELVTDGNLATDPTLSGWGGTKTFSVPPVGPLSDANSSWVAGTITTNSDPVTFFDNFVVPFASVAGKAYRITIHQNIVGDATWLYFQNSIPSFPGLTAGTIIQDFNATFTGTDYLYVDFTDCNPGAVRTVTSVSIKENVSAWQIFSTGLGSTTWTDGLMNTTYYNEPSDYSYFFAPVNTIAGHWYQVEVTGVAVNASSEFYFDHNSAGINLLQGSTKGFFQASYTGTDNLNIDMINGPGTRGVAGHATRQVTHVSMKEITLDPLSLNADMHGVVAGPFTEPTNPPVPIVRDPWDVDEWGRFYPGAGYHQIT